MSSRGGVLPRSSNPALRDEVFAPTSPFAAGRTMTVQGTANKVIILLALAIAGAAWAWTSTSDGGGAGLMILGGLVGFVLAMVTIFVPKVAPFTAPVYALAEGVFLGAISVRYEALYGGVTLQAVAGTFATLAAMLLLYKTRVIRVTARFRATVLTATLAIFLLYLASFVLGLFGVAVPFLNSASPLGILISLFIIGIAALNLVLDFDFIERGAAGGAPSRMEWYGAFGLMVTLVWLYLEIIRLLGNLRR